MKIAILSRYQHLNQRGVESFVIELTKRLPKDWQIDLLTGNKSDSFRQMIKGNYDIVMPLNGRLQSLKASLGRLISPYKVVIGGHSGIGRDDIWNILVAKPDIFIALTDHMKSWAKKWAWGSKVIKIANGVDLEKFNPKGEKQKPNLKGKIILSIGALEWYKHHELAIEAVAKLSDVSLWIVGNGSLKNQLQALGQQKLGTDRFLIEQYDYQKMPQVYRGAEIFTLPSWDREAFGIVYLEAMACGLPVVAPNDSPRREIVGEAGILVDVFNSEDYAKAITDTLAKKWGDKPRQQAEKFSWDRVAKEYIRCFEELGG